MKKENKPFKQKKFDLVFGNPPYNSNVDLKILTVVEPLCKEMVVVHPSTWLLDLKGLKKLYNDFRTRVKNKLKSVEFFNGNPVFNIGLFVLCNITHIDNNYKGPIKIKYLETEYEACTIDNVTKFGKEWLPIVKPFMDQLKEYTVENGNAWQHNEPKIDPKKIHCQLAGIRGSVDLEGDGVEIVKSDFYTLIMKDPEKNKGIRKADIPTFEFNTEYERDNFIDYCKTDFVRFCLALYKNNAHTNRGEMVLIPWMDFTQRWDDKKLYEFFEIDVVTQDYIERFLPDHHGIRNRNFN